MHETVEKLMKISSGGFPIDKVFIADDGSGEPSVIAFLPDAEWDVVMLKFTLESEVQIVTENYTYVTLSLNLLSNLEAMIGEADILWEKLEEFWDEEDGEWTGWEHLATYPEIKE
ncbi:hypothetical protein [uncultured Ruegeria sp.]|uniref:hypothetical protein n=1 Tax=uncultured Ruegeria sp. TaxID=259304 RepID=UPI00260E75E9|nr:hypothetical protein [uncultured Ruegeria sp.]